MIIKSKKHTKLAILVSALILICVVVTACALGASNTVGTDHDFDNQVGHFTLLDVIVLDNGERTFYLENMTNNDSREQMWAVTLFGDGTATIFNAMYVSLGIPPAPNNSFLIEEDELLIYSNYQAFDGVLIARFVIINHYTLELVYVAPPIMARIGTKYIHTDVDIALVLLDIEPIPHVGAAHDTHLIVSAMPLPRGDISLHSIQIGADHGRFGYGTYTLTVHYNLHVFNLEDVPGGAFARISAK